MSQNGPDLRRDYDNFTSIDLLKNNSQNGPDLRRDYDCDHTSFNKNFSVRMDLIYEGITTFATKFLDLAKGRQNGPDLRRDYDPRIVLYWKHGNSQNGPDLRRDYDFT